MYVAFKVQAHAFRVWFFSAAFEVRIRRAKMRRASAIGT